MFSSDLTLNLFVFKGIILLYNNELLKLSSCFSEYSLFYKGQS